MSRLRRSLPVVAVVALGLMVGAAPALAAGGNSTNAKACQKDGYKNYATSSGQRFATSDACTSYAAAKGNTLTFDLLDIAPQPLALGPVPVFVCCSVIGEVTIRNVGTVATGPLGVGHASGVSSIIFIAGNCAAGVVLAPGQSCTQRLGFAPRDVGPAQASFPVFYTTPDGRSGLDSIEVTATGVS